MHAQVGDIEKAKTSYGTRAVRRSFIISDVIGNSRTAKCLAERCDYYAP